MGVVPLSGLVWLIQEPNGEALWSLEVIHNGSSMDDEELGAIYTRSVSMLLILDLLRHLMLEKEKKKSGIISTYWRKDSFWI